MIMKKILIQLSIQPLTRNAFYDTDLNESLRFQSHISFSIPAHPFS